MDRWRVQGRTAFSRLASALHMSSPQCVFYKIVPSESYGGIINVHYFENVLNLHSVLWFIFKVKNKAPAPVQITAEQLLREAKERQLELVPPVSTGNLLQ